MKHLVLWALLLPVAAAAQVHKCQIDGKTAYTEAPCPTGTGKEIQIRENTLDTSGVREQAGRMPKEPAPVVAKKAKPAGLCSHIKWQGAAPTQRESELMSACMKKAAKDYRRP